MSDNKFISRLKGTETTKSVVEVQNDKLVAPFTNVPHSTDVVGGIIDDKDTSIVVAKSAQNWKLNGSLLSVASVLSGDGADYTGEYNVSGAGLWVDAVYTFPTTGDPKHPIAEIFNASTKWVLKLCGKNLLTDSGNTIDFTLLVKIGTSNITTKTFKVTEGANAFCRKFVIDFSESEQQVIKAQGGANLTVQLLCADSNASATIYNGMTVLSALQRRVDADAVANHNANLDDFMNASIIPTDYFSNAEFIDQIEDGEQAYAIFERDGDDVDLAGWTPKEDLATTAQLNAEKTAREEADDYLQGQITTNKGTMDNHIANTNNPHSVTAAQTGALPNTTKYGAALSLTINSTTYVVTAQLKDQDGNNLGTAQTIDLPLESVVVSGAYDSTTKEVVLTLQDGSTIRFSVADLVSGLQTEITALNMLSADLVDDTNTTHKFVTTTEKSTWNGKQDAISDLATIRSGASAGATAVQPSDLATVATSGNYSDLTGKPIEWITYNTTSFADIKTAWDAGKLVLCSYGDRVYVCSYYISGSPQYFYFTCAESYTTVRYLRVSSTDAWINGGQTNQPVISDLATIRSGAAAGATAVQPTDIMTGASAGDAGISGLVPAPAAGDQGKFLQGDGTWANPTAATAWGNITGTLSDQTDLNNALAGKADTATTLAGYGITDGANTDLSNLTSTGANIGNWSSNVTNCITNIPQDIKLELNNGTLTLKAGSKVYVPNGAGVFDEVVIASDLSVTPTWLNGQRGVVYYRRANNNITVTGIDYCFSGPTAPTYAVGGCWYDTANNKIKRGVSGSWVDTDESSLPIAIVKDSSNVVISIDQVFYGFGYIGSTTFVLPGVKGLIPNGRNADGTLYNNEFTINEVHTATFSGTADCTTLVLSATGWIGESNQYSYAEDINYNIWGGNKSDVQNIVLFGKCKLSSGAISNFSTKTTFHAVDYNDTEYMAHQAMPSNRYVNLTLGSSGASYTAPADGYVVFDKASSGANQYIRMTTSDGLRVLNNSTGSGQYLSVFLPVKKNQQFYVSYTAGGTTNSFRFVYAQGAQ